MKYIQEVLSAIGKALEFSDVENSEALNKKLKESKVKKQNDEI